MTNKLFITPKPLLSAKIRLFCFPYAGGSANIFLPWLTMISGGCELVFVQLPGRGARLTEAAHQSMEEVIDELMLHQEFMTSKPFAFFGHSLGSRVCYALASQFLQLGLPTPLVLFASASRAPHLASRKRPVHALSDHELIEELRKLKGTPEEVLDNKELMEFVLPLLRADFKVAETYIATPNILPLPIHVFNGVDDDISDTQVAAWQELTEQLIGISEFAGGHFFINQCSKDIVKLINHRLETLVNL
jgi:surfactin synthase thioesterase subunit